MKIFSLRFNGRTNPQKFSIGVDENGVTKIFLPGMPEPIIVVKGYPVEIEISGHGPPTISKSTIDRVAEAIAEFDGDYDINPQRKRAEAAIAAMHIPDIAILLKINRLYDDHGTKHEELP